MVVYDWFGVVNVCFGVVLGWCGWKMGGIGVLSGWFECIGLVRFGRWVVPVALGWLSLVDRWFGVALGWFWVVLLAGLRVAVIFKGRVLVPP